MTARMLNFVQSWLAPLPRPVGVDFGSETLRMAQVQLNGPEPQLIAAASVDVPQHLRGDAAGRAKFFGRAASDLLKRGHFRGRRILLGLPAAMTTMCCCCVPAKGARQTTIAAMVRDKARLDPAQALVREMTVGEATDNPELVLIAARRDEVSALVIAAEQERIEVVGMDVEPRAMLDCFAHVHRRHSDQNSTTCFIDIGSVGTRMAVSRGATILAMGGISIGGSDFNRAVAAAASVSTDEAKLMRLKVSHLEAELEEHHDKRELYVVRSTSISEETQRQRRVVHNACGALLQSLIRQLELFRGRVERRCSNARFDRLVFVGGEAQSRGLCRSIAQAMRLSAWVGDPLCRMGGTSQVGLESGIDRREPQPAWAIAIGLSLGPKQANAAESLELEMEKV